MGEWIQSELGVMNYIRKGFDKLFTTSLECTPITPPPPQPSRWQVALFEDDQVSLNTPITDAKIKRGLVGLKGFQSSRPRWLSCGLLPKILAHYG